MSVLLDIDCVVNNALREIALLPRVIGCFSAPLLEQLEVVLRHSIEGILGRLLDSCVCWQCWRLAHTDVVKPVTGESFWVQQVSPIKDQGTLDHFSNTVPI
jgi:hypothetical protein